MRVNYSWRHTTIDLQEIERSEARECVGFDALNLVCIDQSANIMSQLCNLLQIEAAQKAED